MSPAAGRYRFQDFEIDIHRRLLLRNGTPVPLTAKAFETLFALVERAGEVVHRDTLIRRLWPDTVVEEANLTQQISTVRKALGETPEDHRFIVTVARQGYRFVSPVAHLADAPPGERVPTIGRDDEMAELRRMLEGAAGGHGGLAVITGEAGIGKSTLVAWFLEEVSADCFVLRGQCSERLALEEPHLPVLEALEQWLHAEPRPSLVELFAARAPSWHAQVAPVLENAATAHARPHGGASQERQKRELAAFLAALAETRPVVLFLDDVHWADASTLDLLLYLASRIEGMRLLVLATYRPSELLGTQEAFVQSLRDLRARRRVRDIALGFLGRDDIARFIDTEFPGHSFPDALASVVHERTEGNPLFFVDLLRELRQRGEVACEAGVWRLTKPLPDVAGNFPPSVLSLVERAIARLSDADRRLLVGACIQGVTFDSAVIARALDMDAPLVEERLDVLARLHGLVTCIGQQDARDGSANLRYAFVHVLYQQALYASVVPSRRAALSIAVAEALQDVSSDPAGKLAHQLALLFEAGRRPLAAVDQFIVAARHAVAVSANREAAALARRGLAVASALPRTPEHLARELQLLITLGVPLAATAGYANPDVERTYAGAREICGELGASDALFPVLWGQWVLYHVRAAFPAALAAAEELLAHGERTGHAPMLEVAHTILGYTLGHVGELATALDHLRRAASFGDPSHQPFYQAVNALDPAVAGPCQQGRLLCLLGDADGAVAQVAHALAVARSFGLANAIGFAHVWSAYVHQLREERDAVRRHVEQALELAAEHGLADVRGWAAVLHAWSGDDARAGAEGIRASLADQRRFGSEIARPHQLGMLAEVLMRSRDHAAADGVLDEAIEQAERTGDRYYLPELHRLKGDVARALGLDPRTPLKQYEKAIDIARQHGSVLFERRAAMSRDASPVASHGEPSANHR